MLGDYYYRKLPRRVQGRVEELLHALRDVAGEQLSSVMLHGSVARGDWEEDSSDVDIVIVLKSATREMLTRMSDALALARAGARVEAMILIEAEIARSADVFPLYYQDIREHHVLLFGSDPFADLEVHQDHVRLRIEQELRDVSIRLRRAVTDGRGDPVALGAAVTRKLRQIRFPLRTLLRMLGDEVTDDLRLVLDRAGKRFRVDSTTFAHALQRPDEAHDQLALLLTRAIAAVDAVDGSQDAARAPASATRPEVAQ